MSDGSGAMDSVREALGSFGKKVSEATKQAEDLAGNVWQHRKNLELDALPKILFYF